MRKTFKREIAVTLLLLWSLAFGWAMYAETEGRVTLVISAMAPVFGFAGLAFGMDWHSKQHRGPTGGDRA